MTITFDNKCFLSRLQSAIEKRSADEFKSSDWSTPQWLTAIAGEVGELCNECKKEWRDGGDRKELIENEFSDVLIYLVAFAIHRGIDIEKVTTRKFNITSEKRGYSTKI